MNRLVSQGDLFWVDFGESLGSEPAYRRPCVVIQGDAFNQSRIRTVVLCVLTTNLKLAAAPGNVLLSDGEGGLEEISVVNVSQIATVDRDALETKIGCLARDRVLEILEGVKLVIEPIPGETLAS